MLLGNTLPFLFNIMVGGIPAKVNFKNLFAMEENQANWSCVCRILVQEGEGFFVSFSAGSFQTFVLCSFLCLQNLQNNKKKENWKVKNFINPLLKIKKAFQHAMCKNITKCDNFLILSVYFQKFGIFESKILFHTVQREVCFFKKNLHKTQEKRMYLQH